MLATFDTKNRIYSKPDRSEQTILNAVMPPLKEFTRRFRVHKRFTVVLALFSSFFLVLSAEEVDPFSSPYDPFFKTASPQEISLEKILLEIRDTSPDSIRLDSEIRSSQSMLSYHQLRFTPLFNSSFNYRESTWYNNFYDPNANNPYLYSEDFSRGYNSHLGLAFPLITGGQIELQTLNNYSEDKWAFAKNSEGQYVRPLQEQSSSVSRINLTQPLLRNAGVEANEIPERLQGLQLKLVKIRVQSNLTSRLSEFLKRYYEYSHYYREVESLQWFQDQYQKLYNPSNCPEAIQQEMVNHRNRLLHSQMKVVESRFVLNNYWNSTNPLNPFLLKPEPLSPPLSFSWQDSYQKFQNHIDNHSQLSEAKLLLEYQKCQMNSFKNEMKPNLNISANYGLRGIGSDVDSSFITSVESPTPEWGAGFVFSVPLSEARDLERLNSIEENVFQAEQNLINTKARLTTNSQTSLTRLTYYFEQWENAHRELKKKSLIQKISDLPPIESIDKVKNALPIFEALNRESWTRFEYLKQKVDFEYQSGILFHDRPDFINRDIH